MSIGRRALLAWLAFGMVGARAQGPMGGIIRRLTERDDGASLALKVGEAVAVTLPENATTGYRWAVAAADPALVTVGEGQADYPDTGRAGSGGAVTWTITARAPGTATVALKRWRSWEGDASIVQRWQVRLTISG